jgi:S-adenosyl-L-methionine hydrolase (adenosine-forming)
LAAYAVKSDSIMARRKPIVTLTTDFGLADHYVAAVKSRILQYWPDASLVDVSHAIPQYNIVAAAFLIERALSEFPPGTIHLAVVDPGVGTRRRLLLAEIYGQILVCPDNGLVTWAWHRLGPGKAYEIKWRPKVHSNTFHGRDIMAPVVARLAAGAKIASLARPIDDPVLLKIPAGSIIYIDHYGNATTNIESAAIKEGASVRIGDTSLGRLDKTYADVPPGELLLLIGSAGLLEIAVREGSAAEKLGLKIGDRVRIQ